jgi:hypothetical protein
MPKFESVRIVLCAEQDAVSNMCFALGMKVLEGWDEKENKPITEYACIRLVSISSRLSLK